MLDIILAIVLWAVVGAPVPEYLQTHRDTETDRLEAHIRRVCPRCDHARLLADSILTEATAHGLDPALLAAIAWTESGYRRWVNGSAGEVGIWQIIPGGWLTPGYDDIRGLTPPWDRLSLRTRRTLARNVRVGTYLAAWIITYHVERCGDHRAACYARYQTGRPPVSRRYQQLLERRSQAVRRRLRGE